MTLSMVMLSLTGSIGTALTAGLLFVLTRLMNVTETGPGLGGTGMMNPGLVRRKNMSHGECGTELKPGMSGAMTTSPGPGGTLKLGPGTGLMHAHGLGGVEVKSHG